MVQLPKLRAAELVTITDSIPLKEIENTKDVRQLGELSKVLRVAAGEAVVELENIQKMQNELVNRFKKEFEEATSTITEEEDKKKVQEELTAKMNNEFNNTMQPLISNLEEQFKEKVDVELSNELLEKLKWVFDKYGIKSYTNRAAFLEVADALGV